MNSSATDTLGANLENLVLTGAAAINGTGNTLANRITGNGTANILDGGAGKDTLAGGAGNDTYVTDGTDVLIENASDGVDTVRSSAGYVLAANLENLTLTGTAIYATGNELANVLTGNASANVLSGGAGNDALIGGAGNDTLEGGGGINTAVYGGTANVTVNLLNGTAAGGQGADTLRNITHVQAGAGNDILTGNEAANTLNGGGGNDTISGGAGSDRLVGGAGTDLLRGGAGDGVADIFVFRATTESSPGAAKDTIEFFVSGIDKIDLQSIDPNTAAGDQAFLFSGMTAKAHSVWYVSTADGIVVRADVDGNTTADMEILLKGVTSLTGNDFLL